MPSSVWNWSGFNQGQPGRKRVISGPLGMFVADANMMLGGHSSSTVKSLPWKVVLIYLKQLCRLYRFLRMRIWKNHQIPLSLSKFGNTLTDGYFWRNKELSYIPPWSMFQKLCEDKMLMLLNEFMRERMWKVEQYFFHVGPIFSTIPSSSSSSTTSSSTSLKGGYRKIFLFFHRSRWT